jgi:pimeloyl-ACP methyl ester carboxylesterase
MTMPYASNDDIKIYYKVQGEGPPLVLQHGLGDSHDKWGREGYSSQLLKKYQLILIDARGHGKSDKPHDPEKYAMKYMVNDIVAVLDQLEIEKAAFWGYSMGGRIGVAIGKYAPSRFNSLIIGGNGLIEKDSDEAIAELQGYIKLMEQGADAMIAWMNRGKDKEMPEWEVKKWRNTDYEAGIAYCSYYENIGMAEYLSELEIPTFVYVGENDKDAYEGAIRLAEVIPDAGFLSLPGLDHGGASKASELVLPHIKKFLSHIYP